MAFTFRWVSTPGQNNSFVNESVNGGRARAFLDDGKVDPFDSPLYVCVPPTTFQGGNAGAATLFNFARTIATCGVTTTVQNPGTNYNGNRLSTGGTFTLNGNACGNYEYNVLPGGTTLTQSMVATLFSSTLDISTWIVCKGDLTIDENTTLIPTVNPSYTAPPTNTSSNTDAKRRLFMVVYATGNLIFTDATSIISMSACGGNTSATGTNIGTFNIPIATNIYYLTTPNKSPTIQSVGGAGGVAVTGMPGQDGDNGYYSASGIELYTAGGGSGNQTGGGSFSGAGGSGSAFSGGTGGGSAGKNLDGATVGSSLGGVGGSGSSGIQSVGGTGNPGGTGGSLSGKTGTGGIVIVITEGTIIVGSGVGPNIKACGVDSAVNGGQSGGASGGGIIAFIQSSSSGSSPNVNLSGGTINGGNGGRGGNGTSYNYGINS